LGGIVPLAEFERRRRETESRLGALERQEQELYATAHRQTETSRFADHAEEFCRRARDGLASADFDRKRALLELLVDRVIVTDGEVEIRYALPTGPKGEREPFCRLRMDYQHAVPGAERLGQTAPRSTGAHHPQHRLQKQPIVRAGATRIAYLPREQRRDTLPLFILQHPPLQS
jgi:hypothetical protein